MSIEKEVALELIDILEREGSNTFIDRRKPFPSGRGRMSPSKHLVT
jgi:hypothetical protein